jgi:hypothetical protein
MQAIFGRGGFDYFANDKNTFYGTTTSRYSTSTGDYDTNLDSFNDQTDTHTYTNQLRHSIRPNSFFEGNLGWQKTFNKEGQTLDVDLTHD